MSAPDVLPYQSDCYVEVDALKDVLTDAYVNDATVTVTLWTRAMEAVTGVIDLSAPYVTSSNGLYRATIPHSVDVDVGKRYLLEVLVVSASFEFHFWQDVFVQRYPA